MKPSVYLLFPLLLLVLLSGKGQNDDDASAYVRSISAENSGISNSNSALHDFEPPCVASAGKLKPYRQVCYDGINRPYITAVVDVAPIVPPGFKVVYVFSSGPDMVITKAAAREYLLDPRYIEYIQVETGLYRIHTLVYNPMDNLEATLDKYGTTRIADIHQLLIQGGGQLCGALDLNGAVFNVPACTCPAKAGTLDGIDFFGNYPCLNAGSARLRAKVGTPSVVPFGYRLRYILSKGDSLVVSQVKEVPDFTVNTVGRYRIHTLVYHISSLNPRSIRPGVTSVREIYDRISQGKNYHCGSINVQGNLLFDVKPCVPVCSAAAGTLKIKSQTCISDIAALIEATTLQAPVVPAGFKVTYVLTFTDNLIIQNIESFGPAFKVKTPGRYRIHTLVYNPATFDFSGIIYGTTQVSAITKQLIQGGGVNCGAWDGNGVVFDVLNCLACTVSAGTLIPQNQPCLVNLGKVTVKATFGKQPNIPPGYFTLYLLTSGDNKVIENVNDRPSFDIYQPGKYRIHTLLYLPNSLSFTIYLSETPLSELNVLLIQGGGKVCAALDLSGALFEINYCSSILGKPSGETFDANDKNKGERPFTYAYPNPTRDRIRLIFNASKRSNETDIAVEILNINGNILNREKYDAGTSEGELDLKPLPAGIYFIRVMRSGQAPELIRINKL